jgi:hypothetical protein
MADGIDESKTGTSSGGIAGFFGGQRDFTLYRPKMVQDQFINDQRQRVAGRVNELDEREIEQARQVRLGEAARMQAARAQGAQATTEQLGPAATIATAPQNQFRSQQQALAASLGQAAAGTGGPSAAEATLQRATDRNMRQALSLALGARGGNQIAALKQAQDVRAEMGQDAAQQAAILRASEQQAAQQALGGVLAGARGADIGLASDQAQLEQQRMLQQGAFGQQTRALNASLAQDAALANAGFQQQASMANAGFQQARMLQQGQMDQGTNIANLGASVQQRAQRDELIKQYTAMGMTAEQASRQAEIQQRQFEAELMARQQAAAAGIDMQGTAQGAQLVGSIAAAAGAAMASDKRAKTKIEDGEEESRRFLGSLKPKGFEYKDKRFGEGHHLGIMAQDVEKVAPGMVINDTDGVKKIDMKKALSASLAALGTLGARVEKLEGRRAKG